MSIPTDARWIPGYEGRYRLTRDARIFSYTRAFPRRLSVRVQPSGLCEVRLWKHGVETSHMLHALVLRVFGPYRRRHRVPIFRDGDRANCHIDNLTWGTHAQRCRLQASPLTLVDVRRIFRSRARARALATLYGVSERTIQRIWSRQRWAHTTCRLRRAA